MGNVSSLQMGFIICFKTFTKNFWGAAESKIYLRNSGHPAASAFPSICVEMYV